MSKIDNHKKMFIRSQLGISQEVTAQQLQSIKEQQNEKGEPYLLDTIVPI